MCHSCFTMVQCIIQDGWLCISKLFASVISLNYLPYLISVEELEVLFPTVFDAAVDHTTLMMRHLTALTIIEAMLCVNTGHIMTCVSNMEAVISHTVWQPAVQKTEHVQKTTLTLKVYLGLFWQIYCCFKGGLTYQRRVMMDLCGYCECAGQKLVCSWVIVLPEAYIHCSKNMKFPFWSISVAYDSM